MKTVKLSNAATSVTRLFLIVGGSILISELLIMMFLGALSPLPPLVGNLLDSALLVMVIFPILYLVAFRPLMVHITEHRRLEEALTDERNLLKALMDNIPDHVYFKDKESRFLRISRSQASVFGLVDPSQAVGKTDFDFFSEEHARPAFEDEQRIMKSRIAMVGLEEKEKWPDGRETWVSTTKVPMQDAQGEIIGTFGISRDITQRRCAEDELRHEKALMDALMDGIPDSIYFKDRQCRLLRISRKMMQSLNLDEMSQAIGKTDVDLFGEEFGRKTLANDRKLMESGEPVIGLVESRLQEDGQTNWTLTTKVPLRDASGRIMGLVGITREINDFMKAQEELKESEIKFKEMFDDAPVGYHEFDAEGRITQINRTELEMLGYTREEMVGQYVWKFSADQDTSHQSVLAKLSGTMPPSKSVERGYTRKDGSTFPILVEDRILRNAEGAIVGIRTTIQDMTELKQAQDKIRKQMSIIEETNVQLSQARDLAMQASKAKSSFLASMSHELRTPLNAIIGYSEILLEEMSDVGDDAYTNDVEKIRMAGNNLLALINDILDLSKIEAGRMELFIEDFDLQLLLREIDATIKPLVNKKSNKLTVRDPGTAIQLRLDHTKVRQILFNLLSNSCKFTEAGEITLSVNTDRSRRTSEHDLVSFCVKDTGIGMTAEQMKKLFKDFSQADNSTTRKYGGTGLGLAITKRFCEMMNGSIDVQSVPNEGTTFTVTLPISINGTSRTSSTSISSDHGESSIAASSGPTVLIIDDDPNVRELLTRILTKEGYSPASAGNGVEGLALARRLSPSVIILDVMMPRKDGWAVLRELKDDPELKSIPVIMHTIIDNRNLGFAIGAQDYLIKPVDHETLLATIKRYDKPTRPLNILVVDDEPDQCEILSRTLLKEGWNVQTADGGGSALSLLAQSLPDVITLDLMMPTMDGFDFLKLVKENEQWSHIPILILTSMDLNKIDYDKLTGSVASILHKGEFDSQQLLAVIRRYTQPTLHDTVQNKEIAT
jgi:PAS domain S-box-containing protein